MCNEENLAEGLREILKEYPEIDAEQQCVLELAADTIEHHERLLRRLAKALRDYAPKG